LVIGVCEAEAVLLAVAAEVDDAGTRFEQELLEVPGLGGEGDFQIEPIAPLGRA
jgi:hypothetical protein